MPCANADGNDMMNMTKRILIISPSWVGDCVMTHPLFQRLRALHPDCCIDVFAPKWSMAVFERMSEVNEIIENPFGHGALRFKERWRVGRALGKRGYDQVIVLPGSLKSALIAFATGIKQRTGYVGESRYLLLNDIRKLDKKALPLMVDRYTALAHPSQAAFTGYSDLPQLQVCPDSVQTALNRHGLHTKQAILALCPGAEYGSAKRWPAHHFARLAQIAIQAGKQVWLFGSPKDAEIADEIQQLCQNACVNLCGKTSLSEAIDLLSLVESAVCNDSGLLHLAAALNRHVVAIYGPTTADHTPPLSHHADVVYLDMDCRPCFQRECPLQHNRCMQDISAENVWQKIVAAHQAS